MASFDEAFGWDSTRHGSYETYLSYPGAADLIYAVEEGVMPTATLWAEEVNKLQNGIGPVETATQYTPSARVGPGPIAYTLCWWTIVSNQNYNVPVTWAVPQAIAQAYFGGNPFAAAYPIFTSAWGYSLATGVASYFPCAAGINVKQELGNLTAILNITKFNTGKWVNGEWAFGKIMIVNPNP